MRFWTPAPRRDLFPPAHRWNSSANGFAKKLPLMQGQLLHKIPNKTNLSRQSVVVAMFPLFLLAMAALAFVRVLVPAPFLVIRVFVLALIALILVRIFMFPLLPVGVLLFVFLQLDFYQGAVGKDRHIVGVFADLQCRLVIGSAAVKIILRDIGSGSIAHFLFNSRQHRRRQLIQR